jgi:hypothetical protein
MSRSHQLRHFVNYHNPKVMGVDFTHVDTFGILTNKLVRDLVGDIVWMIGRETRSETYWLYGRFRVSRSGAADDDYFKYEVQGDDGYWFDPPVALDEEPWFTTLLQKTANFSTGFQSLKDEDVVKGLQSCHSKHRARAND